MDESDIREDERRVQRGEFAQLVQIFSAQIRGLWVLVILSSFFSAACVAGILVLLTR